MMNNYGGRYQSVQPIYTDEEASSLDTQGQNKARGGLLNQASMGSPSSAGLTGIGQSEVTTKNKGLLDGLVRAYAGSVIGGAAGEAAGGAGSAAGGVSSGAGGLLGSQVAQGDLDIGQGVKGGILSGLLNTNATANINEGVSTASGATNAIGAQNSIGESLMRGAARLADMRGGIAGSAIGGLMNYGADSFYGAGQGDYVSNVSNMYNRFFGE